MSRSKSSQSENTAQLDNHTLCLANHEICTVPFKATEHLRAQKPYSQPPASQIRTTQRIDNALQSWGRPPVHI